MDVVSPELDVGRLADGCSCCIVNSISTGIFGIEEGCGIACAVIHVALAWSHLSELSFPSVVAVFCKAILTNQAVSLDCIKIAESSGNRLGCCGQIAYPVIT